MLNSSCDASAELRSRKHGKQLTDTNDDDTPLWSDESQTTGKPSTQQARVHDNTQVTDMSTPSKSNSHRSSLCESSAEDLGRDSNNCNSNRHDNDMWHNGLSQSDGVLSGKDLAKEIALIVPGKKRMLSDAADVVLRIVIVIIFFKLETMAAFKREIHSEELWLYKNPRRPDIVRGGDLLILVIAVPLLVTIIFYAFTRDRRDFWASTWAWTLAVCLNGVPTSVLKITVGRPRPDYFYRCFPDGVMMLNDTATSYLDFACTGLASDINEGRKSFPSGHSSFAFTSFGFVAYYVGAKLHAFDARGRGHTWRLLIAIVPLIVALLVAVSRTCDYHHHWQDVTVGALIGIICGYFSYRQYYPSIFSTDAGRPFVRWARNRQLDTETKESTGDNTLRKPLLGKDQSKWY